MADRKTVSGKDWLQVFWRLALFVAVIVFGAIVIPPNLQYIWGGIFILGLFLLVRWHNNSFAYRCANCGHEFEISILKNFISPHGPGFSNSGIRGWKLLRCPECKKFSRATVISKGTT